MSVAVVVADIAQDRRRFIDEARSLMKDAHITEATAAEYTRLKLRESGKHQYIMCIDIMSHLGLLGFTIGFIGMYFRPRGFFTRHLKPLGVVAVGGPYITSHQRGVHEQEHHRLMNEGKHNVVYRYFLSQIPSNRPTVIVPLPSRGLSSSTASAIKETCESEDRAFYIAHLSRGVTGVGSALRDHNSYRRIDVTANTIDMIRAVRALL